MAYEFLKEFSESRVFPSKKSLEKTSFAEFAGGLLLLIVTLRILLVEDRTFAKSYVKKTIEKKNFTNWSVDSTDLYLYCHGLETGAYKRSSRDPDHVSMVTVTRWLRSMENGIGEEAETKRFFLRLESLLHISEPSARAIRRLVQDWPTLDKYERSLVCTRLLQMLRTRMPKCDLYKRFEREVREKDWELDDVDNPEEDKPSIPRPIKGFGTGGYKEVRPKEPGNIIASLAGLKGKVIESDASTTTSANVATLTKAVGADSLGAGFSGNGAKYPYGKTEAITILRRSPPTTIIKIN